MLFWIKHNFCSIFLRFSRINLVHALSKDEKARLKMPTEEEVVFLNINIRKNCSTITFLYAVADGLKLILEQAGDSVNKEMFYYDWTHDHYVGNVPFLRLTAASYTALSIPIGKIHYSCISGWGCMYEKLEVEFNCTGGRIFVYFTFSLGTYPYLIRPPQYEQVK